MPHDSITSFIEVRSLSLRSAISLRNFGPREKSKSTRELSRAVNGFTSFKNSRVGIGVLGGGRARTTLELSGPEWFVLAQITIDLPSPETAAGVHDFPAITSKNFLKFRRRRLDNGAAPQAAMPSLHCCRIPRY